jgi:hypothetical protein
MSKVVGLKTPSTTRVSRNASEYYSPNAANHYGYREHNRCIRRLKFRAVGVGLSKKGRPQASLAQRSAAVNSLLTIGWLCGWIRPDCASKIVEVRNSVALLSVVLCLPSFFT